MKVNTLIFDLDDTLYPPATGVWDAIGVRINQFIREYLDIPLDKISVVRDDLFHEYGTTLRGLQIVYGIDPYQYLNYVHNIPLEHYLQPNPALREILNRFDARKIIFTNSDQNHALRVIERLQLGGIFESIIDVMDVAPYCKPMPEAFQAALAKLGSPNPETCVLLEDSARNIDAARDLGFHTILVGKSNGRVVNADARVDSLEDLDGITYLPFMQDIWKAA